MSPSREMMSYEGQLQMAEDALWMCKLVEVDVLY